MKKLLTLLLFFKFYIIFSQCIVINEILIDGGVCDGSCNPNTSEWVELYNTCGTDVDIGCYIISDGDWTYVIPEGTTLSAYGFITIGGATNESTNPDLYWDDANYTGTGGIGTFTNGGEQLALFDNNGDMIDGVIWGGGQDLKDNGNTVTTSGGCTVTEVDLPASNSSDWEVLPTDADDCTLARTTNGSSTWERRCRSDSDISFGTTNGGTIPLSLPIDTTKIIKPIAEKVVKTIIKIFTIDGKEVTKMTNRCTYIVTYSDYTRGRVVVY